MTFHHQDSCLFSYPSGKTIVNVDNTLSYALKANQFKIQVEHSSPFSITPRLYEVQREFASKIDTPDLNDCI